MYSVRRALPPPSASRTNWTRLVPPPVLTGHVSSLLRTYPPPVQVAAERELRRREEASEAEQAEHRRTMDVSPEAGPLGRMGAGDAELR